jgi:glycosyltransferase involved in cell wall biosynthesis
MSRPSDGGRVIFTIASANYLAHAATLMQSVRARHPEARRVILLADAPRPFEAIDLAAELLPCDAIGIALIENMKLWYSCIEFNTAIKPYAFRYFFANAAREVVYLDPDIQVFSRLDAAFAALGENTLVLTPHITEPLCDHLHPDDLAILKSGVYNLGFLAMRQDEEGARLLDWWAARTFLHCRVDVTENMFTDQRWLDLAPAFVARTAILRDAGYNVAYWNIPHRLVQNPAPGQWTVNGQPLIFYHYSGLQPDDPTVFSRYQTRYEMADLGAVARLCDAYRARLAENLWDVSSRLPYAYGKFANGRPIEDPMRRWLLRAADEARLDPMAPLAIDSEYFDAPDETAAARGVVMTRMMYQLWLDRPDLRSVFDLHTPRGLDAFIAWFSGGEAEVDGRSIAAAAVLYGGVGQASGAPAIVGAQPWESVAAEHWAGSAREAAGLLEGDLWAHIGAHDILLPRQAALLWELRSDLQEFYPLHNLDRVQDFIGWAITAGCVEAGVDPAYFSPGFLAQQAGLAHIAGRFTDLPITEALRATRKVALRREYLNHWEKFPQDRLGRLAHGLWFAFVAPRHFGWPDALAAPVRAWFEQPGDVGFGDFTFNRAELALWELRPDLQSLFPLNDRRSCWGFLHWLCADGLYELKLSLDEFDPRLRPFLAAPSPRMFGLSCAVEMIYEARDDLRAAFDVQDGAGRAGLQQWVEHHFRDGYANRPLGVLRAPSLAAEIAGPVTHVSVALVGQWHAMSGRGEDVRGTAAALDAVGYTDYLVVDRDSGEILRPNGVALSAGTRLEVGTAIVHLNAETALQDWVFLRTNHIRVERSIGFWAWELERLPHFWRHAFSFYNELWASTSFARSAFAREGLRPVHLVPLTVSLPPLSFAPRKKRGREAETVFFFMFDFRSFATRKNPEGVVQAFLQAFPAGTEKVRLVIKTQAGAASAVSWRRLSALCTDPRIELRDVSVPREALLAMIAEADVFVSLHRSEGFGRGPAEAMLLERPVIATGYSGTTDFISADCAYVVSHSLRPVLPDQYPGVDGQSWAEPDIGEAAGFMRHCHAHPKEAALLGRRGAARVRDLYNPGRVGQAMLAALNTAAPEAPTKRRQVTLKK